MPVPAQLHDPLVAYVPHLLAEWLRETPDAGHRAVEGTLAFLDISGFTTLTERLARKGRVGAEEMSDALSDTFAGLLTVARDDDADLVKWGGDAVLLLFRGPAHAQRACRAATRMRGALRDLSRGTDGSRPLPLRMSVGVHSGTFDFFLVGDPAVHRELLVAGPEASRTAMLESTASAGQIVVSDRTRALLAARDVGRRVGPGAWLLRAAPAVGGVPGPRRAAEDRPADQDDAPVGVQVALSPAIREHLRAVRGEPEHRWVTVAFVKFSGTDALFAEEGPGSLARALDEVVRAVQHGTESHGVTFLETDIDRDGGKVMLVAGAPRSAGHDEQRMLRACRQILDTPTRLSLRIGVNRGNVFCGDFGPAFRRTYSVKGDAVNLAARVMGAAEPGGLLATTAVTERSSTVFSLVALAPFLVKGKRHPVRASLVGEVLGSRQERGDRLPLVGREREISDLTSALTVVRSGTGRMVEVVGEPGIGKSRLVQELLSSSADVLGSTSACQEYESSTAYFPFRHLLRDALGVPSDADPVAGGRVLADQVHGRAAHLLPWLPLIALAADVEVEQTAETDDLDESFRKGRLETAVGDLLAAVLPGPAVLVIEDVHLMDDASASLTNHLRRRLDRVPWLLVVTRREFPVGYLPEPGPELATVRPGPLDAAASLALVQAATERQPLPRESLQALATRAGGNPMFLESLAGVAGETDAMHDLPESVEDLVTSQVDRLDPRDRTVLRYASVLGVAFDEAVLRDLVTGHDASAPGDVSLEALGGFFIADGPGRLRFRHALMRDVAYEGLPFRRRRHLHEQVARTLVTSAARPGTHSELLSMHFFHAGVFDEAWTYSRLAGERARAKFAHGEAIDFFGRAVESARRTGTRDPSEVGAVLEALGDARFLVGLSHEAGEAYAAARRALAPDPVRAADLIVKQARVEQRLRRLPQSMRRLSRGLNALAGDDRREARRARSLLAVRYAVSRFSQGRTAAALDWAALAAREAEDAADRHALALAYASLHGICVATGESHDLPYGEMALQAYVELDDLPGQAHCLNNLAVQALGENRWPEALETFRQATVIFGRIGDSASEGNAMFNQADVLVRQGRCVEATDLLGDALHIAKSVSDDELVALVRREAGRAHARSGGIEHGLELLAEAGRLFATLDEPDEVRRTTASAAEVHMMSGGHEAALDFCATLLGDAALQPDLLATVHRIAGFSCLGTGHPEQARVHFADGRTAALAQTDRYEAALNDWGARARGAGEQQPAADAASALRALGVVALPLPGRGLVAI